MDTDSLRHRFFGDARDNAAMILEYSNACPFKYRYIFGCSYCPFTSPDFGPLKTHTEMHKDRAMALHNMKRSSKVVKIDVTNLKCEICQENIKDISLLFEHLINIHEVPLKREFEIGVVPYLLENGYTCADCGLKFDLFSNLNTHMNIHFPNYICSECGKVFSNEIRFKRHVHQKTDGKFQCLKCDEMFPTDQLKCKHMATKHNVYRHKCPYCNEYYKTYADKVTHLNKYHGKNINYPCAMCPVILKSASNRASHVRRVHMKEKQCACTVCGDRFVSNYELKNHMITHSGEKNHFCQVCNKAYGWKKSLKEHMRIHNEDRRFICVTCDKAFFQKCSLTSHLKTHHPELDLKVEKTLQRERYKTNIDMEEMPKSGRKTIV